MMNKVIKSMFMLAAGMVITSFVACSKDDSLPQPQPQPAGQDYAKKATGLQPAKVVVTVYNGHLHGYGGFHQNGKMDETKFLRETQTFKFTMKDGKWVGDASNAPYLYVQSFNKYQNSEAANQYAFDIKYYDAADKDITENFVKDGQNEHHQHFFLAENVEALSDFDAALDKKKQKDVDLMRYDYIDPKPIEASTPWPGSIHEGTAKLNGKNDPLGFKGLMTFGYSRHKFDLNIRLMESKEKKTVALKTLPFRNKNNVEKYEQPDPREIADWTPTDKQKKEEAWYPAIKIPVMIYMDWDEMETAIESIDEIEPLPKRSTLNDVAKRLVKSIETHLGKTYPEIINDIYYQLHGTGGQENGAYWF